MAIQSVEVSQDVGQARAVALLGALRDPSIAEYLSGGDREKLGSYGGKYHYELTHADALWMATALLGVVSSEAPRTRTEMVDDGVNPAAK